jgi:signal transduction histidine kinase
MAEQIHQGIKTLDRIINNCLQFSRDISPKISNIANPQLWLEQIVNDVVVSNKADNISISINVASNCNICVDKFLMQQAIVNILVNAIDAVQAAKQKYPQDFEGKISINSYQDSIGKWHLCITDNGLGIKNEQLRKIFDPFFTTKEKGTGLGLAIVHSIVTAHGGSIEIQSIQEEETTIDITI